LFDVMDTLVHEPFHVEMPAFFGLTLEELMREKHPTAWIEFELGRMSERDFLHGFFRDARAFDHERFLEVVHEAYRWLPGMEALLSGLARSGHAIHALSNYPQWFEAIEARLAPSRFLKWSFVSCRTGVRKPDAQAFIGAAEALGVPASACLLIDDRAVNCQAARAVGMEAVRFVAARELETELARRGICAAR
jgi:HAD superfamily hydrolase (TIGR01509 family)